MVSKKYYDALKETERVARLVLRDGGLKRAYRMIGHYKFYYDKESILATMSGCNMRCSYCLWEDKYLWPRKRAKVGEFLSPEEAFKRVEKASGEHGYRRVRITGGEPTIGWKHTRRLARLLLDAGYEVVLETNGILPAYRDDIVDDIAGLDGMQVRVSIKASTPRSFRLITGVESKYMHAPLETVKRLVRRGVDPERIRVAIMLSFDDPRDVIRTVLLLKEIDERIAENVEGEIMYFYWPTIWRAEKGVIKINPKPFDYPWEDDHEIPEPHYVF